jgi:DUF4097 and DUF4098 domain-containing protein YvlB
MMQHFAPILAVLVLLTAPLGASGRFEGSIQTTWDQPAGVTKLIVDADRQDVVVKAGGTRVTGRLIGDSGDNAKVTRDGSTLTIVARTDRSWLSWGNRTARVELLIPPGIALDVTSVSGAILVQVPTTVLRARSESGDIEAPLGTGSADADSTSGTIRLKGFGDTVRASTVSGDLALESVTGTVVASTLSGDLKGADLVLGTGSRFTTDSGDVRLSLRDGLGKYSVRAATVSGTIQAGETSSDRSLALGQGGASVTIQAVSGDIQVR